MGGNYLSLLSVPASDTQPGIEGRDKKLHPTVFVGCNCLYLPLMPASGTQPGIKGRDK